MQGTKELYKRYGKKLDEPLRREQELYRQFIQLLMAHYTKEHEVAFYAEKCGVTAAHFSSAIRRASGYSPLAIITEIIIMNAKAQLKTTRLPVKEIAFSLGFNNHSFSINTFVKGEDDSAGISREINLRLLKIGLYIKWDVLYLLPAVNQSRYARG